MRRLIFLAISVLVIESSVGYGQATHKMVDGFDFGVGSPVNPNKGWTFGDAIANPLTTFTQDWNAPDFAPGQPGWEGPTGSAHAGWAKVTALNALASGFDVVENEIATHGNTNVIYTPSAVLGDPFTSHHSVSISGTLHNLRQLNRSGPWILWRNNTSLLASGIVDDNSLSYLNGPLNIATGATFIDASQVTVSGNELTGISYNPGDFFNLTMANNDFVAVDLTVKSFSAPGKGFGSTVVRPKVAYYRFEEPSGIDVVDSLSGDAHGIFANVPAGLERSTDVPVATIPKTGAANTRAADFRQGGSVLFNSSEFIFNEATAGGVDGGATLEWYMKVPNDNSPDIIGANSHTSIFWTNGIGGSDSDRYNIFWDANFTGALDSDRFISADFRATAAGGGATPISTPDHNTGVPLTEDQWHHIAIVRNDDTPANTTDFAFTWNWYFDGVLNPSQTASTTSALPAQDVFGWTIAGRPGFPFYALIDEVRLTAASLTPSDFLNSTAKQGDFDVDGDVDGRDFLVWQRGGSPNPGSASDFALWKGNFGSASPAGVPTPEPSASILLAISGLGLACGGGRRTKRS